MVEFIHSEKLCGIQNLIYEAALTAFSEQYVRCGNVNTRDFVCQALEEEPTPGGEKLIASCGHPLPDIPCPRVLIHSRNLDYIDQTTKWAELIQQGIRSNAMSVEILCSVGAPWVSAGIYQFRKD